MPLSLMGMLSSNQGLVKIIHLIWVRVYYCYYYDQGHRRRLRHASRWKGALRGRQRQIIFRSNRLSIIRLGQDSR